MKYCHIFLSFLLFVVFTTSVNAQVKRYVKPLATGNGSGSSWANASADLQAMMDLSEPMDQVWVARGTYFPPANPLIVNAQHNPSIDPRNRSFILKNGVQLYGGFAGSEISIGQRNLSGAKTILSGDFLGNDNGFANNNENAYHVIINYANNYRILLDGFSITGGNSSGIPETYIKSINIDSTYYYPLTNDGSGIYSYYGDYELYHCIFYNNYSAARGGAVYAYWGDNLLYSNCVFVNNYANNGAIGYFDDTNSHDGPQYYSCTMAGNSSPGYMLQTNGSSVVLQNSILWHNGPLNVVYPVTCYNSIIEHAPNYVLNAFDEDPMFTNIAAPNGADNILGTSDDGLIPQCGKAIGGSYPPPYAIVGNTTAKDIRGASRYNFGEMDLGAYETGLRQQLSSLGIRPYNNTHQYCKGATARFYTVGMGNGGVYQWKINNINVGTNSNTFSTTLLENNDVLTCTVTSPAGCGPATVLTSNAIISYVAEGMPARPARIAGPTNACKYIGTSNLARYTIPRVTNAQSYHWSVFNTYPNPVLFNIVSGQNDTSVLVSFQPGFTNGTIQVEARSYCGSTFQSMGIVRSTVLRTPGSIVGATDVCSFMQSASNPAGTPVTYSIRKVTDANSYNWTVPAGATILSHPGQGEDDTAIIVRFSSGFVSGSISVQAVNGCTTTAVKSLAITRNTATTPGTITGPAEACLLMQSAGNPSGTAATYSIKKVKYATSYTWTIPPGATAIHPAPPGESDSSIVVTFNSSFTGGNITVVANSNCSVSATRSLAIKRTLPGAPGSIIGATDVCPFMQSAANPAGTPTNYVIKKVALARSYNWTLPAGATASHPAGTGVNDTIISVTFSSNFLSGSIAVSAVSNCGSSSTRTLAVSRKLPSTPGTITASAPTICPQRRITYSLSSMPSNATAVVWTVPASGTIISGQGTLSLTVQYNGATFASDSIRASGTNNCAVSSQRKLKVGILAACPGGKTGEDIFARNNLPVAVTTEKTGFTVQPNPSYGQFTLLLSGYDLGAPVSLQVTDVTGRTIENRQMILNKNSISVGLVWKPGIYFATITQSGIKRVTRLVKL